MRVRIADVRKTKGVSQGELAEKAGISRPYMAQLESGVRNLTTQRQALIANALGVDPTDLVDFSAPNLDDEQLLLVAFRTLTPAQRSEWLKMARIVAGSSREQDA